MRTGDVTCSGPNEGNVARRKDHTAVHRDAVA